MNAAVPRHRPHLCGGRVPQTDSSGVRPGRRARRRRRALRFVGAAAFALLLLLVFPSLASADNVPTPPTPSTTPTDTRLTPNPQPGPSPLPPGSGTTPTPTTPGTPSGTGGSGSTSQPAPADGQGSPTGDDAPVDPCATDDTDCLPQPSAPAPPSPQTTPTAPDTTTGTGGGGGVIGWITRGITNAINSFFRGLVTAALNPLLDLLGRTLLTTPKPSDVPAIGELWSTSWEITVAGYGLLIMIGGITVMSFQTVQTRTSIKEIAPRIPLGFLAAALSQFMAGKAIELVNPLPAAILGQGLDPDSASKTLKTIILGAIVPSPGGYDKSIFVIFLGLFLAGSVVALLCTYIARVTITVVLIGAAPFALAGHALPQTEKMAFWWWRAFFSCLGIQIAQSFVLIASFKVFFTPGGFTVFGPTPDGVVNLLAALTLIFFLFKIPFWLLQSARIGNGSGILGRVVRAYVMGRALGLLGGRSGRRTAPPGLGRGRGRANPRRSGGPGGRGRPDRGSTDPYARVEADADGQLLLPLTRVPRVRRPGPARGAPRPPRPAPGPGRQGPRHRQLTLPFDQAVAPGGRYLAGEGGAWVDRDGQYLLPFEVDHIRPPAAGRTARRPAPTTAGARPPASGHPAGPRARQLELPFDPYRGIRPDRSGQYALPLEGLRRTPRPPRAAPPAPLPTARPMPSPRPAAPRYRQLMLPQMPRRTPPRPPQPDR